MVTKNYEIRRERERVVKSKRNATLYAVNKMVAAGEVNVAEVDKLTAKETIILAHLYQSIGQGDTAFVDGKLYIVDNSTIKVVAHLANGPALRYIDPDSPLLNRVRMAIALRKAAQRIAELEALNG